MRSDRELLEKLDVLMADRTVLSETISEENYWAELKYAIKTKDPVRAVMCITGASIHLPFATVTALYKAAVRAFGSLPWDKYGGKPDGL